MKVLGKRQRKDRSRARLARARANAKRFDVEHSQDFHSTAIKGVAFYPSDGGPCNCFGDSVRWIRFLLTSAQISSSTRAQLISCTRAQLLHQGADPAHLIQLYNGREAWNE